MNVYPNKLKVEIIPTFFTTCFMLRDRSKYQSSIGPILVVSVQVSVQNWFNPCSISLGLVQSLVVSVQVSVQNWTSPS